MSKDARNSGGLVPQSTPSKLPAAPPAGAVVDMQDLMPVIQSFQDHMAAEQARQRERMRTLATLFVLALVVSLALPLWVVKELLRDQQATLAAQQAAQAQQAATLEKALLDVAASTRALRETLSRGPAQSLTPADAPVVTGAPPSAVNVPAAEPPTVRPAPAVESAVIAPGVSSSNAPPVVVQAAAPVAVPVAPATSAVAVVAAAPVSNAANAASAPAPVSAVATQAAASAVATRDDADLVNELRKIEQALAEKQRQMKLRQKP